MYPRDTRGGLARLVAEASALLEIGTTLALRRSLQRLVPHGDGHTVMLVPGFTATDRAMGQLRRFLWNCGYDARGWGQGRNVGVSRERMDSLGQRLNALVQESGSRVSVIGWSGGGMYARALGSEFPDRVRQVITMGTPFKLNEDTLDYLPQGIYRLHERLSPRGNAAATRELDAESWNRAPPVPSSSLFSERDALAPWPFCLDHSSDRAENIQVPGSHAGMTWNPLMYYVIADRLAQAEGEWRPFALDRLRGLFFRHGCASEFSAT